MQNRDKITAYSTRGHSTIGSWPKTEIEKEIEKSGTKDIGWVECALSKVFAGEKDVPIKAVETLLAWSSSGRGAGSVVVSLPSDGSTVSVVMT